MSSSFRAAVLLSFLILPLVAQAEEIERPAITATMVGERIRFTSAGSTAQIRVQIFSAGGDSILDTQWVDGNIFDWVPENLDAGLVRCLVMAKDLEGRITVRETTVAARGEQGGPKVTALTHDGTTGAVVSTTGDLSFRFGDYLAGTEREAMRLTNDGLEVEGVIRIGKGIELPDGTILTSISDVVRSVAADPASGFTDGVAVQPGSLPSRRLGLGSQLKPQPHFTPGYQFVVDDTGVTVGTTNPAFKLHVAGTINTASEYRINNLRFADAATSNTTLGHYAGSATAGAANAFFGYQTGNLVTTGSYNSLFGYQAGASLVTGENNAFFGIFAGVFTTASYNTFFGSAAGYHNSTGASNTAMGYHSLFTKTTGDSNTAIGRSALEFLTSGTQNLALGYGAGSNLTSGSHNVYIATIGGAATESNTIRIGDSTFHSRLFVKAVRGVTTEFAAVPVLIDTLGQLGTASSSRRYKFDIRDMNQSTDDLMRLRPVVFRYRVHGDNAPLQYGLIAEEVEEVYPELVARNAGGEIDAVLYQFLPPMLLNEVQKQRRTIEEQQRTIDALVQAVGELMRRMEALESRE